MPQLNYRYVRINQSSIDNSYILLTSIMDFFPPEIIGGKNKHLAAQKARLCIGTGDLVDTDIDGTKYLFRERAWTRRFFHVHSLVPGDQVIIECTGQHTYHLYPYRQLHRHA
jgi:hypothetical protein